MMKEIENIKTPEDILEYMEKNIEYGWVDINGEEHIDTLKNFRRLYRTGTVEETIEHHIGTCIEQVNLMRYLLEMIGISSKMYCTRIYEGEDFNNLEEEEHMHCFLLYFLNDKAYQLEHPNPEKVGIYEFASEEQAVKEINDYYVKRVNGQSRPVTEFPEVIPNLSFKEFNLYINNLDELKSNKELHM